MLFSLSANCGIGPLWPFEDLRHRFIRSSHARQAQRNGPAFCHENTWQTKGTTTLRSELNMAISEEYCSGYEFHASDVQSSLYFWTRTSLLTQFQELTCYFIASGVRQSSLVFVWATLWQKQDTGEPRMICSGIFTSIQRWPAELTTNWTCFIVT